MNRDERLSRAQGLPPARREFKGTQALLPSEPNGGTWIAVSEHGISLALINWYSAPQQALEPISSRGGIIPSMIDALETATLRDRLRHSVWRNTQPFRLIAVSVREKAVIEWRWNGKQLESLDHPWALAMWISSGHDEPGAEQTRGATFLQHRLEKDSSQRDWLRQLHTSHLPEACAYSICMHRNDAQTVSYSEITLRDEEARFEYCEGPPCHGQTWREARISIRSHPATQGSLQEEGASLC